MYIQLRNKIKVVQTNDLGGIDIAQFFTRPNGLCITATRSMKHNANKVEGITVCDYTEFEESLLNRNKREHCLKESEQRYILHKTIDEMDEDDKKQTMHNSISSLYNLYSSLLLADVDHTKIDLPKIFASQPESVTDVLELYIAFYKNLLKTETLIYQSALRNGIEEFISQYDEIVLLGFAFFNDLQAALFAEIMQSRRLRAMIISDEEFILNKWLMPLFVANNLYLDVQKMPGSKFSKFDELREKIFDVRTPVKTKYESAISLTEPAPSREVEFRYIISRIVDRLGKLNTREEIEKDCQKIAIALVHDYEKNTRLFNEILKTYGIFISGEGKIYTSRDQYLEEPSDLPYPKRIRQFNSFARLEFYNQPHSLFKTPLGRYIQEIYRIASNGMNAESFNILLTTNWFFAERKDAGVISDFARIKEFFSARQKTEEWLTQIDDIIKIKKQIQGDEIYSAHPFTVVSEKSLEHFRKYISFINGVVGEIKRIDGNIKKHLMALIKAMKDDGVDVESELLLMFGHALNQSKGMHIDHLYFAKNFQALIGDYIIEKQEESKNIRLNRINLENANQYEVVFLPMFEDDKYPNTTHHDFPFTKTIISILENERFVTGYAVPINYDSEYSNNFARYKFENLFKIATDEIVFTRAENENGNPVAISVFGEDLMRKADIKPIPIGNTYKPKLEKAATKLKQKYKPGDIYINELIMKEVCPKQFHCAMQFPGKLTYADKFTLTLYARAIIIYKIFERLADNKTVNLAKLQANAEKALVAVCDDVFTKMPLFDDNDKNDLRITARRQVLDFIKRNFAEGQFKPNGDFTLTLGAERKTMHKGVTAHTRKSLVMTDLQSGAGHEFDISKGLDFLTTSSRGYKTKKTKYSELLAELRRGSGGQDRLGAANFMAFKVNTQFSGKYMTEGKDNGVERVQNLINDLGQFEYANTDLTPSGACMTCLMKEICMGGVDND